MEVIEILPILTLRSKPHGGSMPEVKRVYRWGIIKSSVFFVFGAGMAVLGVLPLPYWISQGVTPMGWAGIGLYVLLFEFVGIPSMFLRQAVTVDPETRSVTLQKWFCFLPVYRKLWLFSDFTGVKFKIQETTTRGGIHSYSAHLSLLISTQKNPIHVDTYLLFFKKEIPPKLESLGLDLAGVLQVPLVEE